MSPTRRDLLKTTVAAALAPPVVEAAPGARRSRLRDLGLALGLLPTGAVNAITDVAGVAVGHTTLLEGQARTGVTAILPRGRTGRVPCRAGAAILNGNGEMTGITAVRRTGLLAAPVFLTGTANIGIVYQAALELLLEGGVAPNAELPAPVVAECWDAIGDIRGRHIRAEHVRAAVASAASGRVSEGAVGGGTGMTCYDFKGGVGTASRVVAAKDGGYTVGVIVNANHGARRQLTIAGVPVGRLLEDYPGGRRRPSSSIVMVAATDAPLEARQIERLALRLGLGLARTGAVANTSSGDLMLAFSTAPLDAKALDDERVTPLYQAAVESAEEAVLNALAMAVDVRGVDDKVVPALPLDRVVALLRQHRVMR